MSDRHRAAALARWHRQGDPETSLSRRRDMVGWLYWSGPEWCRGSIGAVARTMDLTRPTVRLDLKSPEAERARVVAEILRGSPRPDDRGWGRPIDGPRWVPSNASCNETAPAPDPPGDEVAALHGHASPAVSPDHASGAILDW